MVVTDVRAEDVARYFKRFADMIGEQHWLKAVTKMQQQLTDNPYADDLLREEYAIPLQLASLAEEVRAFGGIRSGNELSFYDAVSFIAQVVSMSDADKDFAPRLHGKVRGAFVDGELMRGLLHELRIGVHLKLQRHELHWPDTEQVSNQSSGCDIIITSLRRPIHLDCKSFGVEVGRQISRWAVGLLFKRIEEAITPLVGGLTKGLSIVVTVPARLEANTAVQDAIVNMVREAVIGAIPAMEGEHAVIQLREFDPNVLRNRPKSHSPELRRIVDGASGAANQSTFAKSTAAGGAIMITVQSRKKNRTVEAMFDILKTCAARQLPPDHGGLIIAEVSLSDQALANIAKMRQETGQLDPFGRAANAFWRSPKRNHVAGLAFVAQGAARRIQNGQVQHTGLSYYLKHDRSRHWLPELAGLFPG